MSEGKITKQELSEDVFEEFDEHQAENVQQFKDIEILYWMGAN